MDAQYTLHGGQYGGFLIKILYSLVGVAPNGLFITGLILWQQRRWAEARRKEARKVLNLAEQSEQLR
ncbi:hypothetical protein NUACC26_099680 [Scytonema sp. NUACC26]